MLLLIILEAFIQGISEFLPVSSSGHLALFWAGADQLGSKEALALNPADEMMLDVAVHLGTLLAVLLYFWRDIRSMLVSGYMVLCGRPHNENTPHNKNTKVLLSLIVASLPLVIVGYFFKDLITNNLRSAMPVIAGATIVFGILLGVADRLSVKVYKVSALNWSQYLMIGLFQVLALIPGVSRSGITMTAARFCGVERAESARYSMLLSIPAILGAGTLTMLDLIALEDIGFSLYALLAALLAFIFALIAIGWLMSWLRHASFTIFVVYRIVLGVLIFAIISL